MTDTPFFTNGHTLEYVYDAGGNKLRKIVRQNGVIQSEQDYVGGLEYRKIAAGSRRVESLYHTEGRYYNLNAETNNTLNWRKEYHLRDHPGNLETSVFQIATIGFPCQNPGKHLFLNRIEAICHECQGNQDYYSPFGSS